MMKVFFVRHGQSEGNLVGVYQGRNDYDLTELGQRQAKQCTNDLRKIGVKFSRVVTSPQTRAKQTATVLAELLALPLLVDGNWREVTMGDFDGEAIADIVDVVGSSDPKEWLKACDGGESEIQVQHRIARGISHLRDGDIVVSHGILGAYLLHLIGDSGELNFELFRRLQGQFLSLELMDNSYLKVPA